MTDLQKEAFEFLKIAYEQANSSALKGNIALAIGGIGGSDAFNFLTSIYEGAKSSELKSSIALAIGKCS